MVPMEQWLEVQSGDSRGEGWVRMGDPSHRRSRYRWTVPVLPCLQHRVRLSVVTKSGNTLTYTVPNPVARATQDQLENSRHKFVPESVKSLNAEVTTESSVRLSWLQSPCATNYEIYVARRNVETDEKSENTSDTRLVVSGLEACTDYDVSVYANLATESSDEATADFTTPPLLNAADDIVASVKDEVSEGSVFISWSSPASLQCVLTYTASVCDQAGVCKQKEEVPNMGTGEQIHYTATNMETCSNYTVKIQPQFGDRQLQPKMIQYSTWNQECVKELDTETHTEEVPAEVREEVVETTEDNTESSTFVEEDNDTYEMEEDNHISEIVNGYDSVNTTENSVIIDDPIHHDPNTHSDSNPSKISLTVMTVSILFSVSRRG